MDEQVEQLLDGLMDRLHDEGIPRALLAAEVEEAREHVRALDLFLRRLRDTLYSDRTST